MMSINISTIIKRKREDLAWDQAELARRLDVSQQTVSRWESGTSRPQRGMIKRLSKVISHDEDYLLQAAGYKQKASQTLPVRPLTSRLPLASLSADRFEQFTADFAHMLFPDCQVSLYGSQGHKQQGIDVIAMKDGKTVATFQCKRIEKKFGPSKIHAAVKATGIPAEKHYLFVTKVASPGEREAMNKYPNWVLWDIDDISREIFSHRPIDQSVRLIDRHFPGHREHFLGVSEPSPWQTCEEFFRPLMGQTVYTQVWPLVGREKELKEAENFLQDDKYKVAILEGIGGIGKSRLLREIAIIIESSKNLFVRFAALGHDIKPADIELLPTEEPLVIIVDDCHDRSDINNLVASILDRNRQSKIILATRTYNLNQLYMQLNRIALHSADNVVTLHITNLSFDETEALAKEVLIPGLSTNVSTRIAKLGMDCPFITVVGAALLNRGIIDERHLEKSDTIREEIMREFENSIVVSPNVGDPELRREVLQGLAILQPFRADEESFRTAIENLTGQAFDRVSAHIKALEDTGILLHRGKSLRIIPDLLGDSILARACFNKVDTGYINRAFSAASGKAIQHVFINANRVDWQITKEGILSESLIDSLWQSLDKEFKESGVHGRLNLLELLKKVAYFQPKRVLKLIRWAINNPTNEIEKTDSIFSKLFQPSYENVIYAISPLLDSIAHNFEHLPEAADLLWKLAERDDRQTNSNFDHPIRILAGLAEFQVGKPLAFNKAMVDSVVSWFEDENIDQHLYSPIDILEVLLATESYDTYAEGHKFVWRPFKLNLDAINPIREQVLSVALKEAKTPNLKRAVRAIRAIEKGLHYPVGYMGRPVDEEEYESWTPKFVKTIDEIRKIASDKSIDPVISVAIMQAIHGHTIRSKGETKTAAENVIKSIPKTLKHELALRLYDGWGHLSLDERVDYHQIAAETNKRNAQLIQKLGTKYSDEEIVDLVDERLIAQKESFIEGSHPSPFIAQLVEARPLIGEVICQRIREQPSSLFIDVLPVVLGQIGRKNPNKLVNTARTLLETDSIQIARCVSHAFGWNRGHQNKILDGEIELLQELSSHEDDIVRSGVIRAADQINELDHVKAVELFTGIPFHDSPKVAEDFLSSFFGNHGFISIQELTRDQEKSILKQLLECPSIEEYHITKFISEMSKFKPDIVVELLQERIERSEKIDREQYKPLPYSWNNQLQVRGSSKFKKLLKDILDWISNDLKSWQRRYYGADLFKSVAVGFDKNVVSVLEELIETKEPKELEAVEAVLGEAPRTFVFNNVEFVCKTLHIAQEIGADCLKDIGSALHKSASSGVRSGTAGQPFGEDIEQRDQSLEIADKLPIGSVEREFYLSLYRSAEESIRWHAQRDEMDSDWRDW